MTLESFGKNASNHTPAEDFVEALVDSAIQRPYNALSQLVGDRLGHIDIARSDNDSLAVKAGNVLGFVADMTVLSRMTGAALNPVLEKASLTTTVKAAVKAAAAGTVYGGVFSASDLKEGFLKGRLENAAVAGSTFAVMGGMSNALGETEALNANTFKGKILSNAIGGGVGGMTNSFAESGIKGTPLTVSKILGNSLNYAAFGAAFGAADAGIEKVKAEVNSNSSINSAFLKGRPATLGGARPAFATVGDGGLPLQARFFDQAAAVNLDASGTAAVNPDTAAAKLDPLPIEGSVKVETPAAEEPTRPGWDKGVPLKELAAPATGKGDSWVQVYREAFTLSESDPVHAIRARIESGACDLYESRLPNGRVATFSLFDRVGQVTVDGRERDIILNSYNATRPELRGAGIGSKHMEAAISQLLVKHPDAIVVFEIDHCGLAKLPDLQTLSAGLASGDYSALGPRNPEVELTAEEQRTNLSRLKFYQRLEERTGHAAMVADIDYKMPNLEDATQPPLPAHLMYFSDKPLSDSIVAETVRALYTSEDGYGLNASDPLIKQVTDTAGKIGIADKIAGKN